MKKLTALLLTVCMSVFLIGCGEEPATDAPATTPEAGAPADPATPADPAADPAAPADPAADPAAPADPAADPAAPPADPAAP